MKKLSFLLILVFAILFFSSNSYAISITYDNLNTQAIATVIWTGDYDFDIYNNTGVTWTDFHFQIDSGSGPPVAFSSNDPYTGPGTYQISGTLGQELLDVDGLNIIDGSTYSLTLAFVSIEGAAFIGGTPTVGGGGTPVPEPSTIFLMGLGIVGLAGFGRRKIKK